MSQAGRAFQYDPSKAVHGSRDYLDIWWSCAQAYVGDKIPTKLSHFIFTDLKWKWTGSDRQGLHIDFPDIPKSVGDFENLAKDADATDIASVWTTLKTEFSDGIAFKRKEK